MAIPLPRSKLFVPGNRPERMLKAAELPADALSLDLEDAVPDAEKAGARLAVASFLRERPAGPREQHHVPGAEVADERLDVGRGHLALEADHEALADAAEELLHPPSFFLTASFTRLPSTDLPEAESAASAAFIALPMSLSELAPVSATALSTAACTSASLTSAGR